MGNNLTGSTEDETPAAACMRHYRLVSCRKCSKPTPGYWSTEPSDVALVRRFQQCRTPQSDHPAYSDVDPVAGR